MAPKAYQNIHRYMHISSMTIKKKKKLRNESTVAVQDGTVWGVGTMLCLCDLHGHVPVS